MKILKVGRVEPEVYKFECDECGCVFEADPEDITWPEDGLSPKYIMSVNCPCCYSNLSVNNTHYKEKVPEEIDMQRVREFIDEICADMKSMEFTNAETEAALNILKMRFMEATE